MIGEVVLVARTLHFQSGGWMFESQEDQIGKRPPLIPGLGGGGVSVGWGSTMKKGNNMMVDI